MSRASVKTSLKASVKPSHASRLRKPAGSYRHGDLREAALLLAIREVEARGHSQLSLDGLADRLGVTRPALYRHYRNRKALLEEVAARGYARFQEALFAALRSDPDPWRAIYAMGKAYVRFAAENPGWFRLQFSKEQAESTHPSKLAAPEYLPTLAGIYAAAFGADNPELDDIHRVLWAQAHGLGVMVLDEVFRLVKTKEERIRVAEKALAVHLEALHAYKVAGGGKLGLIPKEAFPGIFSLMKSRNTARGGSRPT